MPPVAILHWWISQNLRTQKVAVCFRCHFSEALNYNGSEHEISESQARNVCHHITVDLKSTKSNVRICSQTVNAISITQARNLSFSTVDWLVILMIGVLIHILILVLIRCLILISDDLCPVSDLLCWSVNIFCEHFVDILSEHFKRTF